MPPPALSLSDLAKSVPGGRVLFERLNLELAPGEFIAIMGESGVGKSTLLNLIAGLDAPDRGQVAIDGVDIARLDEDARTRLRRDKVGFVFQAFHILPHLDLAQNVALPLALQGAREGEALERAAALLAEVGLEGRAQAYPKELSGGEMQRVAIARALIHRPTLLLADEPTGNLDPDTAARVLEVFAGKAREAGAAVVLVTHSEIAASAADRTFILGRGGLVARHG
ncbi:ABC transporter ATP-binding protein [Phenylobacterium koreense]|uniref:ABC transport system ATP-binding protein n=1 Tax=Phenylobacterium koreense TaxID=266125 RepID=A0ABV2EK39_9CAUL